MASGGRTAVVASIVVLILVVGIAGYVITSAGPKSTSSASASTTTCLPLGGTSIVKSQLQSVQFGAVKEYALPQQARWPNAIVAAPDGSVWFGEESVPGVGHLYLNGTLVEYPWPTAGWSSTFGCGYRTGIWGMALWNGMTWATDGDEDALVGVSQRGGQVTVINLTSKAPEPYTLTPSPDGSLWFTTLGSQAQLGRVSPDLSVSVYSIDGLKGEEPLQVEFVNSTVAYFVAINITNPNGHLYQFNPATVANGISPVELGGNHSIIEPSSLSVAGNRIWITQHGASSLASFDPGSKTWITYPTSTTNFTYTTLPYFVQKGGQGVWFNEHYSNRIAFLNSSSGSLTEYSEANPPVVNEKDIQNDLTIASGSQGLWFTSTTGNYIGFVDGTYRVPFSLAFTGSNSGTLGSSRTATLDLQLTGTWTKSLQISVSDSEAYNSVPKLAKMVPSMTPVQAGSGPVGLEVTVNATGIGPGRYTLAVSASDGLTVQTAYYFLTVP